MEGFLGFFDFGFFCLEKKVVVDVAVVDVDVVLLLVVVMVSASGISDTELDTLLLNKLFIPPCAPEYGLPSPSYLRGLPTGE